ncbi:nuclear transport factor 2 family protein [Mycolicibacterium arenosum]|uniref:Nuclear transport factor 2 family protein n=1 Tax=Mycolicibacterium arenosum TaxID=2952157 RepID=A0ABT1LVS7_9MYCO|nr:nuclear transport factor 2 family protein [Mycolicibacterium sp. CAU 1645]MCP9270695.1 nuclear transport factor 2 family protein [Mycolicibacterium sp. CAU 1645]
MSTPEDNANTVKRYLELAAQGRADDVAALYADDATVEDPVGGEIHIGREAIRGFYGALPTTGAEAEIFTLRTLGHEAAFFWALTIDLGENKMRIEIISVMTFTGDGQIATMKAYWTPENVTQL